MRTQKEKGEEFRLLHQRERAFVLPNPWDVGTARMLAHMGFEALATTRVMPSQWGKRTGRWDGRR